MFRQPQSWTKHLTQKKGASEGWSGLTVTPVKYLATNLRIAMIMKLFEIVKQISEIMIISESYV